MNHLSRVTQISNEQNDYVTQTINVQNNHSVYATQETNDKRLKPKERKHVELWQCYLMWTELMEMRKRHTLRAKSVKAGKSNMSDALEEDFMEMFHLDMHVDPKNKEQRQNSIFQVMVEEGQKVGPIWDWLVAHKGVGERLAAPILALIDDIGKFDTIAKLWRYAGYGMFDYWVDENGKVICPREGWKWVEIGKDKNKYRVWTVVDSHSTDVTQLGYAQDSQFTYVTQLVYANTTQPNQNSQSEDVTHNSYAIPQNNDLEPIKRVDYLEPDPTWMLKKLSDRLCSKYHSPYCTPLKAILWNLTESFVKQQTPYYVDLYYAEKERLRELHPVKIKVSGKTRYNDGHINNMAKRKMRKEFLKQLWLKWREFESLPVTQEYHPLNVTQVKDELKTYS